MLLDVRKNRCSRFEPPVGTEKRTQSYHKKATHNNYYIIMGQTINKQKTPPKKKAKQGMELERRSPRGHKSATREIEVNPRKRGTGPQGRGGKIIAREQELLNGIAMS